MVLIALPWRLRESFSSCEIAWRAVSGEAFYGIDFSSAGNIPGDLGLEPNRGEGRISSTH
jgi:hypothetical protein